jgi:hypothetical protein
MGKTLCKAGTLAFCFLVSGIVSAQNRYALVIGNNGYQNEVTPLNNPVNDAEDIAGAARELGYEVTLLKNVTLEQMLRAVDQFSINLSRSAESEGFFWFAGHGLSVREQHYLLPINVNPESDNMITRTSYSVDELMGEIEKAGNKTNLIVIDACRNRLLPGNSNRSRSVGSRGLAVLSLDDARIKGNKIVYSTAAGKTAADGAAGSRNSPFAEAFLHHINSPQTFDDAFIDISTETMRLTRGEQEPYSMGTFAVKSYSLSPAGRQQVNMAQVSATAQVAQQSLQAGAVAVAQGSLNINTAEAGQLTIVINGIPYDFGTLPGYAVLPVSNVNAGEHQAIMRYSDGYVEQVVVSVARNQTSEVDFQYKIRPAPIPGAPNAPVPGRPAKTANTAGKDAWKNKWLYIGFLAGGGSYAWEEYSWNSGSYNYYTNSYLGGYEEWNTQSVGFGAVAGLLQAQLWKYFALELDIGVTFSEYQVLPVLPVLAVLTFKPGNFNIDIGAGYTIGAGAGFKGSLGIALGPGILFAQYLGVMGNEDMDNAFISAGMLGYKFGVLDK